MNNPTDETPEIIDLGPEAVTDHDTPQAKQSSSAPETSRARSASPRLALLAAALLLSAAAGAWIYKDFLWRYMPNDEMVALASRTKALEDGKAELRDQLGALERLATQLKADMDSSEAALAAASSDAKAASDSIASLSGRVDGVAKDVVNAAKRLQTLSDEVARLPSTPSSGTGSATVPADLLLRLEALEKDVASLKAARSAASGETDTTLLSQSLSDLKAKIAAGTAFADEQDRLARLVPAAAGLDVLRRHAATGLPNAKALAAELKTLSASLPGVDQSVAPAASDDSWLGWALDQLSDLVTIRVAGATDWKRIAEAAAAMAESDDLPQAIEHLSAGEGTRPAVLQQWLERASARLELESSLKAVEEAVLRVIAAKG